MHYCIEFILAALLFYFSLFQLIFGDLMCSSIVYPQYHLLALHNSEDKLRRKRQGCQTRRQYTPALPSIIVVKV